MPPILQTILVLAAILIAGAFLARQVYNTLAGKRSKLGSCCSTGCAAAERASPSAHEPAKQNSVERVQFLPVEMLGRKK